jgi:hypothetical protein
MEHPNDAHLRRQIEDKADALANAMQASAPERDRANDEAAFERAVTTADALLHGRADGVKEVSLTMGAVTIYIRGPRDDTEIEMDLTRRLHNARGENLIEAAALLWATGCYLRDQERRVANAVAADMRAMTSMSQQVGVGQAGVSVTNRLENRRLGFPFR